MTLLTSYPLLREDFEKWISDKPDLELAIPAHGFVKMSLGILKRQPEPLQHFYLSLYAESVGYKIREYSEYGRYWKWRLYKMYQYPAVVSASNFPAAFDHFAQIREKELNKKEAQ